MEIKDICPLLVCHKGKHICMSQFSEKRICDEEFIKDFRKCKIIKKYLTEWDMLESKMKGLL